MPENNDKKFIQLGKRAGAFTAIMFAIGIGWSVLTKTYAFAQRVETYIALPDWLHRVEKEQKELRKEMRQGFESQNRKLEAISFALQKPKKAAK